MIRQGEVFLIPVNNVPEGYIATAVNGAKLAIGETGNAHVLVAEQVEWLHAAIEDINAINQSSSVVAREQIFVWVQGDGKIAHSDRAGGHFEAPVPEGLYRVGIKREQMPWEQEARAVLD